MKRQKDQKDKEYIMREDMEKVRTFINKSKLLGDDIVINSDKDGISLIKVNTSSKEFKIPDFITSIGYTDVFSNCENLEVLYIPDSIKVLDIYGGLPDQLQRLVLSNDTSLIKNFPDNLKSLTIELNCKDTIIGTHALSYHRRLIINNQHLIGRINYNAIEKCSIKSLNIPSEKLAEKCLVECDINKLTIRFGPKTIHVPVYGGTIKEFNFILPRRILDAWGDEDKAKYYITSAYTWCTKINKFNLIIED